MSSNLRVNNILPSVGTNVAIGTAGGSVTLTGSVSGSITSGTISGVSTAGITTAYINTLSGISTIDASSAIGINQNLVFASGKGIDFSATTNSSGTMTSELLSDYERGTWTPSFVQPATSANMYVNNGLTIYHADYVKIGNLVYVSCYIQNDASFSYDTGRSGTDSLGIGGLPFTVSNTPTDSGYHPIYVGYFNNWTSWSASYTPMGYFTAGTNNITLVYAVLNGISNITATYMYSSNSTIILSGWYRTDS